MRPPIWNDTDLVLMASDAFDALMDNPNKPLLSLVREAQERKVPPERRRKIATKAQVDEVAKLVATNFREIKKQAAAKEEVRKPVPTTEDVLDSMPLADVLAYAGKRMGAAISQMSRKWAEIEAHLGIADSDNVRMMPETKGYMPLVVVFGMRGNQEREFKNALSTRPVRLRIVNTEVSSPSVPTSGDLAVVMTKAITARWEAAIEAVYGGSNGKPSRIERVGGAASEAIRLVRNWVDSYHQREVDNHEEGGLG